jgi:hypothetical protein
MRKKRKTVFFVQIYRNLGVAFAAKLVALGTELVSDLSVAVEFAINDSMYIAFCIMERLFSFRIQVDDRKTIVSKSCLTLVTCPIC